RERILGPDHPATAAGANDEGSSDRYLPPLLAVEGTGSAGSADPPAVAELDRRAGHVPCRGQSVLLGHAVGEALHDGGTPQAEAAGDGYERSGQVPVDLVTGERFV